MLSFCEMLRAVAFLKRLLIMVLVDTCRAADVRVYIFESGQVFHQLLGRGG